VNPLDSLSYSKDLTNAWAYRRSHQEEIEQQILDNEAA
jgi:hypothetical protein